jgi:hypothetical protein
MDTRTCNVSFTDYRGTRHAVEVEAETLFEAAALGIQRLKACDWIEGLGPATRLQIEVRQPTTQHELTVAHVRRWCDASAANPAERLLKDRLRAILL